MVIAAVRDTYTMTQAHFQPLLASHLLLSQWSQQITWSNLRSGCGEVYSTFSGKSCRVTRQRDWVKIGGNNSIYHRLCFQVVSTGDCMGTVDMELKLNHIMKKLLASARQTLKIYIRIFSLT